MGAGLLGKNGLAPHISHHIWVTYALPRMLYGLDAAIFKQADITKLERFQRKILRQLQFLPEAPPPANAAVYGLLGAKPVEAVVDAAVLTLFGNIARDVDSVECEIAERQLAVKKFNSRSWFMKVRSILNKYNLPSAYDVIAHPPSKVQWKSKLDNAIVSYWSSEITEDVVK
jgi:hypothetical protein